jgi:hypothetical protein
MFFPLLLAVILLCARAVKAQADTHSKPGAGIAIYGGYSYLSNSFNNHSTFSSGSGMNGWDADVTVPAFRMNLKIEGLGFYDDNLGDAEHAHFFLAGPVLKHRLHKDTLFAQGLAGFGHINAAALSLGGEGANTNTFAADMDGGIDIPFAPRIAWRVQGGVLYSAFSAQSNQISGLPRWFGRFSTGVVMHF